ncbi:Pentatricopeptide repeat-containing protein [Drosera capensis]
MKSFESSFYILYDQSCESAACPSTHVLSNNRYHHSWTSVTYNVVIDAFGKAGDLKQMEYLFRLMQSERMKPNCVTFCSLMMAYGRANKAEKIEAVLRFIKNSDVMLDRVFFNCLMDAYGRIERFDEMKEVLGFMESKGCEPDRVTYRTMINAYSSAGMNRPVKEVYRCELDWNYEALRFNITSTIRGLYRKWQWNVVLLSSVHIVSRFWEFCGISVAVAEVVLLRIDAMVSSLPSVVSGWQTLLCFPVLQF